MGPFEIDEHPIMGKKKPIKVLPARVHLQHLALWNNEVPKENGLEGDALLTQGTILTHFAT